MRRQDSQKINTRILLLSSVAGFAALLYSAQAAHASGFGLREGAADWLGNAFAGDEAKAYDASTVWSNPAGMALLDSNEFQGNLSVIAPYIKFHGSNTNVLTGSNVTGTQGGNDIAPAATGAMFGVYALAPNWRLGVSVTAPYGERTAYPDNWVGRYQSIVSSITDINMGLALSYKVNDQLSIGGGPNFDYFQARLTQALNAATVVGGTPVDLSALYGDPIAQITGNSIGVGYNLGALYQFDDKTRIGIDYRSRIRHDLYGAQNVTAPAAYGSNFVPLDTAGTTSITLPDSVSMGIFSQVTPQLALLGSLQWTEWSLFKQLDVTARNGSGNTAIVENYRDTWFAAVGANYQLTDKILLQTGFAYDESPVTSAWRTSRVPDADHYDLGIGVQYKLTPAATIEAAYGHVFTLGGKINNSAAGGSNLTPGTLTGSYDLADNSATLGLDVKF